MDERKREFQVELGGRTLSIETGRLARQADGAVLVRYGDTAVLVTATMSKVPREGIDFFPLLVDYEERLYAKGSIPGGWMRREGRPGEVAILTARMIDRPMRPLFPKGVRNDVQVVATTLSVSFESPPDIPAMVGASAALSISSIPFGGPVGAVRVGRIGGELVLNPSMNQESESDFLVVVAGTRDGVMMVEAACREVPEADVLEAIMYGYQHIQSLVDLQERMKSEIGREKVVIPLHQVSPDVESWVERNARSFLAEAVKNPDKSAREDAVDQAKADIAERFAAEWGEEAGQRYAPDVAEVLDRILKDEVRKMVILDGTRPDGRDLREIRPIWCEVGLLPMVHGSGLFTRGQTQVLTTCTLGLKSDEQMLDDLRDEDRKRYIHHYNFPPFSVGEVRPVRGPGRRDIGHGALAERALIPVIPTAEEFPYTLRLVSEVLESNGSTSQASVCGSTLALMDAGVPIRRPVAGVAMGLVRYEDRFAVLSDIQGIEDAMGDMDFKVAGTERGITALQMDIKIHGVTRDILRQALEQAREGRMHILSKMLEVIAEPRSELSPRAPRILTLEIPVDKIREVIGPGGKMIRKIIEQTGVEIDIEDDGRVFIASTDQSAGEKAQKIIEMLIREVEVGATYVGKVTRIMNFGAFVEILPGKEGLVHISQLAPERVGKVEDVVNIGDEVTVRVTEIDRMGRVNLSRKDALPGGGGGSNGERSRVPGRGGYGRPDERRSGDRPGDDRRRERNPRR